MIRVPGRPVIAEFSLSLPYQEKKADPNRYYQALGLSKNHNYSMNQIRTAFRVQVKKYHPDGSEPDPVKYEDITIAFAVLSDFETRRKYDNLEKTQLWLDARVTGEIIKQIQPDQYEKVLQDIKQVLKADVPEEPLNWLEPEEFCYYHYEGETLPDPIIRDRWFLYFMQALWSKGHKGEEVKVGFSQESPHIVERVWGKVFFVSGNPNIAQVLGLLDS